MGFNKRYIPEVSRLKELLVEMGESYFLKIYLFNPDARIGSKESFDFIDDVYENQKLREN
jgi:hypothetical protein